MACAPFEFRRPYECPMRAFEVSGFDVGRLLALLLVTAIGLYVCYLLVAPFLPALVWALTGAVLVAPVHRAIAGWLRYPSLSAAVSVTLIILVVVVPLVWLLQQLAGTFQAGVATAQAHLGSNSLR